MDQSSVFKKTAKGAEETEKRTYKLDIRSRAALLAVNGTDSVETIIKRFHGLEQLAGLLAKLESDGFIVQVAAPKAKAGGNKFDQVLRTIVGRIHELLGPDGDAVCERLEDLGRTSNNPTVVMQFLEQRREMFEDIAGKQKAAQFFEQVGKLLA